MLTVVLLENEHGQDEAPGKANRREHVNDDGDGDDADDAVVLTRDEK